MTKRLLLLNGLAVLAVPLHHATGYGFRAMFEWTDRYLPVAAPNYDQIGSLAYYVIILIQQLDNFALPAFLFVSGFFIAFAAGGSQSLKWNAVMARLKYLMIPFVFWTMAFFIILLQRLPLNLVEALDRYYYIPLLAQFYLVSPFIVPLARNHWKLLLSVTGFLELGWAVIRCFNTLETGGAVVDWLMFLTPRWLIPTLFFWFTLGVVAGFHRQPLAQWLDRVKWRLLAAMVILGVLTIVEYQFLAYLAGKEWLGPYFGGVSRKLYSLAFILCFLAFDKLSLPFSKQISQLGGKSLGIYLAHSLAMYVAAVMMYRQTPWVLGNQLLYQGALIVIALVIPLLLMSVLSKSAARGVYRYVFG